ncbi:replication-associated recombination protein A [uncultured Peptoniphilus sp.]|uniref:replication-associated recombination protein A n=1 Tax=uncultured Peptoniphilus sp. TaxID=254354 RepID=UPI0028057DBA|nr:replication-associated recombination protein A [uncultured Peptoniphilus sp.]
MNLFDLNLENNLKTGAPLADRMRPRNLDEFLGQDHILSEGKYLRRVLKAGFLPSMLFYGPPGIGKTTLAKIIANSTSKNFVELSAVTSNVKELRKVLEDAEENLKFHNVNTILFIDEIHRFNKSQQDALLPFVERGIVVLIGATTENPYFEVNKALLSRMQILNFLPLKDEDLNKLIDNTLEDEIRGLGKYKIKINKKARDFLIRTSSGDARYLLNSLELAVLSEANGENEIIISEEVLENSMVRKNILYDKGGNEHYDTISAFIKSVRGSDPNAALYYLAKMIESGEDIKFIARRLIILASEDIGNANPMGIVVASACFQNISAVGMPEARIILGQTTAYLASSPKSNAVYLGINKALEDVRNNIKGEIPQYLRDQNNPANKSENSYLYPHDFPSGYVKQEYLPQEFKDKKYYQPKDIGYEKEIRKYFKEINEDEKTEN